MAAPFRSPLIMAVASPTRGQFQCHPGLQPFLIQNVTHTGNTIGSGSYGNVIEVAIPGALCAAKKIHDFLAKQDPDWLAKEVADSNVSKFLSECAMMSRLRHPHIVQFLGLWWFGADSSLYLVMEKMMTSLHDVLENGDPKYSSSSRPNTPLGLRCSILQDIARGLAFLHKQSPPVIHRDLSARNVLLNSAMTAKIADLGMARIMPPREKATMTKAPGALVYMPPEALDDSSSYNCSIDIFSLGVLVVFLLAEEFPTNLKAPTYTDEVKGLMARTELQRRENYTHKVYNNFPKTHPLILLMESCLENQPKKRPSIDSALQQLEQAVAEAQEKDRIQLNRLQLLQMLREKDIKEEVLLMELKETKNKLDDITLPEERALEDMIKDEPSSPAVEDANDPTKKDPLVEAADMTGMDLGSPLGDLVAAKKTMREKKAVETDRKVVTEDIKDLINLLSGIRKEDVYVFGTFLGVPDAQLKHIEQNYSSNHQRFLTEVITAWINACPATSTWSTLVEALAEVGRRKTAEGVAEERGLVLPGDGQLWDALKALIPINEGGDLVTLLDETKKLRKDVKTKDALLVESEERLDEVNAQKDQFEKQYFDTLQELEEQKSLLEEEKKNAQKSLREKEAELRNLRAYRTTQEEIKTLQELEDQIAVVEEETKKTQKNLREKEAELRKLRAEQATEEEIEMREIEIMYLKKKVQQQQAQEKELMAKIVDLQQKLEATDIGKLDWIASNLEKQLEGIRPEFEKERSQMMTNIYKMLKDIKIPDDLPDDDEGDEEGGGDGDVVGVRQRSEGQHSRSNICTTTPELLVESNDPDPFLFIENLENEAGGGRSETVEQMEQPATSMSLPPCSNKGEGDAAKDTDTSQDNASSIHFITDPVQPTGYTIMDLFHPSNTFSLLPDIDPTGRPLAVSGNVFTGTTLKGKGSFTQECNLMSEVAAPFVVTLKIPKRGRLFVNDCRAVLIQNTSYKVGDAAFEFIIRPYKDTKVAFESRKFLKFFLSVDQNAHLSVKELPPDSSEVKFVVHVERFVGPYTTQIRCPYGRPSIVNQLRDRSVIQLYSKATGVYLGLRVNGDVVAMANPDIDMTFLVYCDRGLGRVSLHSYAFPLLKIKVRLNGDLFCKGEENLDNDFYLKEAPDGSVLFESVPNKGRYIQVTMKDKKKNTTIIRNFSITLVEFENNKRRTTVTQRSQSMH